MKVREIMTANPVTCFPNDNLATVAQQMWDWDCGVVPVVDDGQLRGVITDRDICMALLFKGAPPAAITVADVVNGHTVYSCAPDDEVAAALDLMREHQVHRLPVIEDGRLSGLLSLNDVVLEAGEDGFEHRPTCDQVVDAMRAICAHRQMPIAA